MYHWLELYMYINILVRFFRYLDKNGSVCFYLVDIASLYTFYTGFPQKL